MIAIGIDPGLAHTGFAAVDEDSQLVSCAVFTTKRDKKRTGDTQARLVEMLANVRQKVESVATPIDCRIAVEWPMVAGRGDAGGWRQQTHQRASSLTFAAAGGLVGMLRGWQLETPLPATWRAVVMPKTKTLELHAEIERLYGVSKLVGKVKAPHACDAIGLALYAMIVEKRREARKEKVA